MKKKIIYVPNKKNLQIVLSDKSIPPGAKVILFNLLYRLGGKTYSFPSQKTIGEDVGLSDRQVRNHLKKLKEKGIISWRRGTYNQTTQNKVNSNEYCLINLLIEKEVETKENT